MLQRMAPTLEMAVIFNFGQPIPYWLGTERKAIRQMGNICIAGPLREMVSYEPGGGISMLTLPFINDGFYRFLCSREQPVGLDELQEEHVLRFSRNLEALWKKLAALPDMRARVDLLNTYLPGILPPTDPQAADLVKHMPARHDTPLDPVKTIAGTAAISPRSVQLRFRRYAGYSPKELLRFLRFKQLLASLLDQPAAEKVNWFDLIVRFGYHDQSHLNKDFRHFTGLSPTQFLRVKREDNFCISRN